jgi:MYXO-CTERM domain-containing protein
MKIFGAIVTVFSVLAVAVTARAHPGYPQRLQMDVGAKDLPPCQTCHVNPEGSGPLRSFGLLLVSDGLDPSMVTEDDASLDAALKALKTNSPNLYADLQTGMDPNADPGLTAVARPIAEYGCAAAPPRGQGLGGLALLAGLGAFAAWRRRQRSQVIQPKSMSPVAVTRASLPSSSIG